MVKYPGTCPASRLVVVVLTNDGGISLAGSLIGIRFAHIVKLTQRIFPGSRRPWLDDRDTIYTPVYLAASWSVPDVALIGEGARLDVRCSGTTKIREISSFSLVTVSARDATKSRVSIPMGRSRSRTR